MDEPAGIDPAMALRERDRGRRRARLLVRGVAAALVAAAVAVAVATYVQRTSSDHHDRYRMGQAVAETTMPGDVVSDTEGVPSVRIDADGPVVIAWWRAGVLGESCRVEFSPARGERRRTTRLGADEPCSADFAIGKLDLE